MQKDETCAPTWNWHREVREVLILIAVAFAMTISGISCDDCGLATKRFWLTFAFTATLWVVLYKGNQYLTEYISARISWIQFPVRRFIIGLVVTFVFTFSAIYAVGIIFQWALNLRVGFSFAYSIIITLIISLFLHGRAFLLNWRQSAIDAEKLKRESMASRYETLKSQVNPHFLFNSFNALSNLVYEDQEKAVKFIKQLSEVYRYVLDTRDKERVPLEEELQCLSSYIFLQQIRFGEKLSISIGTFPPSLGVAPLALQMLIENAIKHNVVSEDDPLKVELFFEDGFIVVRNNLQTKSMIGEPSSGVGLDNIVRRYEFLTDRRVRIEKTERHFIVRLPGVLQ